LSGENLFDESRETAYNQVSNFLLQIIAQTKSFYSRILQGAGLRRAVVGSTGFVRKTLFFSPGAAMDNVSFLAPRRDLVEQLRQDNQSVLLDTVSRAVTHATNGSINDLQIEVIADALQLTGECNSFYTKQLAQHTALRLAEGYAILNDIHVRGTPR
jgi:hypothetical protein